MIYLGLKAVDCLRIASMSEDQDEYVRRQTLAAERWKEKPLLKKLEELAERGYVEPDDRRFLGYRLTAKGERTLLEHAGEPGQIATITIDVLTEVGREARSHYPEECCGVVLASHKHGEGPWPTWRVFPCLNVQTELHQIDPRRYPKDGREAYALSPDDFPRIQALTTEGWRVTSVYHSHVEAPPVFSRDDAKKALVRGQPLFPGVDYLVVGISLTEPAVEGVNSAAMYRWNPGLQDFLPVRLVVE